ncbi:hypothetical protein HAX54_043077 [Datura stramonium]|uniref:Phytocyanin domain-containing protein n=1 Tax=Datura stramonium TaxID=4076 RepID=A0ABS8W0S3_DATST|nr:hypothetical protein [Datura stramonium]
MVSRMEEIDNEALVVDILPKILRFSSNCLGHGNVKAVCGYPNRADASAEIPSNPGVMESQPVYEVTKGNFDWCNITNALKSSSKGNTSFPLTEPGESYFICGNRLHCLGGMKLHVNVEDNNRVASPAAAPAPQAEASNFPKHSSKSNNPSTIVPSSTNLSNHVGLDSILLATLGLILAALGILVDVNLRIFTF